MGSGGLVPAAPGGEGMSLRCVDVRAMMGPTAGPILVCAGVCGGALSMIRNPIRARQDLGCKKTKEAQAEVRRKGKRQQSVGKGPLCNKHCLSHQRVKGHHLQSSRGGKGKLSCLWLCVFATGLLPQKKLQPHFPVFRGSGGGEGGTAEIHTPSPSPAHREAAGR